MSEKRSAGRPKGSRNKIQTGQSLRNRLEDRGHDVDRMMIDLIVNNADDWKVMKELLPYLYRKMPQEQEISTDGGIPMLVVTTKQDDEDDT